MITRPLQIAVTKRPLISLKCVFILSAVVCLCSAAKKISIIFVLAEGTNELEAITTIYVLRLAGFQVVVAGLNGNESVSGMNGIVITPDVSLEVASLKMFDAVVFAGGEKSSELLKKSDLFGVLLKEHEYKRRYIATSGSGPIVLDAHEIGFMKCITSAPQYKDQLSKHYKYKETDITVDGKLVTNRYSGKSMEFALSILNHMHSSKLAENVARQLLPI